MVSKGSIEELTSRMRKI